MHFSIFTSLLKQTLPVCPRRKTEEFGEDGVGGDG
jgi:hypothetical protein